MEGSSEEVISPERADLTKLRHAESDLLAGEAGYRMFVDEARRAASRLVKEATWADEIINRTSAMFRQGATRRDRVDVNAVVAGRQDARQTAANREIS
jgi:hypothetical protein